MWGEKGVFMEVGGSEVSNGEMPGDGVGWAVGWGHREGMGAVLRAGDPL